jgi:hypothetical protein
MKEVIDAARPRRHVLRMAALAGASVLSLGILRAKERDTVMLASNSGRTPAKAVSRRTKVSGLLTPAPRRQQALD